jgi:uncharacterized protein (DUF58 family)
MLAPELIKKIKHIHIRTGRAVDSMMAGQYHSAFKGAGIEFEEVREYTPGDEVKSIDWNVSARFGRPFIKRYREERELVIMLMVDMSASGAFGTLSALKRETAAELAAILAFNAIRNNDKVGAILFTDRVELYIPPKKGASHVWRVIKEILAHEPQHHGTSIAGAAHFLGKVTRKRSVSFLISDFIDEYYGHALKAVSGRHDLIGVMVSDPGDFRLPGGGIVSLRDLETGETVTLDAFDRETAAQYESATRNDYRLRADMLQSCGVDLIEISTAASVIDPVRKFFRYRERIKAR